MTLKGDQKEKRLIKESWKTKRARDVGDSQLVNLDGFGKRSQ